MQPKDQKEACNFALKLISVHPRTCFEIEKKLKDKEFSQEVINQTIKELKDQDYLNDQKYTQAWLEERIRNRPCGKALAWKKLREKGIDEEMVEKVLAEILTEKKEIELAKKLAQNKKAQLQTQKVHYKKIPGKIGFFLQSRGFSTNIIMEVLDELEP